MPGHPLNAAADTASRARLLAALMIALLLCVAIARVYFIAHPAHGLSSLPTMAYVLIVLFFARAALGMDLINDRFGTRLSVPVSRIILLAVSGLILIKGYALLLEPWLSELLASERNTQRFDAVRGDRSVLISLIVFSWVIVFFEELAFRIVLFGC